MISNDKSKEHVLYQDRQVEKESFRAFVYNDTGQKLANSYQEYEKLTSSGIWFSSKKDIPSKVKAKRNKLNDGNS